MADPIEQPAEATEAESLAQIKSMLDLPETASDVEVITALMNVIVGLQAKYEEVLKDATAMEDAVTNRDIQDFSDIIREDTVPFWKEQLLTNRAGTLETLAAMREKLQTPAVAAPVEQAPASVPLRNRLAPLLRTVSTVAEPKQEQNPNVGVMIRNRAHELVASEGISFMTAFARAEKEITNK